MTLANDVRVGAKPTTPLGDIMSVSKEDLKELEKSLMNTIDFLAQEFGREQAKNNSALIERLEQLLNKQTKEIKGE
tara:strand:- start:69 stop:296 length:228 start_codon:yes stop_codon:yes gene_type:complete